MKLLYMSLVAILLAAPLHARDIAIEMPVKIADVQGKYFGLIPFGAHIPGHGPEGHAGYDLELRPNTYIYAAASGLIRDIALDKSSPGCSTITITHRFNGDDYVTTCTGIAEVAFGIRKAMPVQIGQMIGKTGLQEVTINNNRIEYSMIHFQLDNYSMTNKWALEKLEHPPLTDIYAVNLQNYLSDTGKAVLAEAWKTARYEQQLCEPYMNNPRVITDPMDLNAVNPVLKRTWTKSGGPQGHAQKIRFTRPDLKSMEYKYELMDDRENVFEAGTAVVYSYQYDNISLINMKPANSAAKRAGTFSIHDSELKLDYGDIGSIFHPGGLNSASTYSTGQ